MCHALCFVPGILSKPRYSWSEETQSGYVEAPDNSGSMFGIFVFSLAWGVDIVVLAGLLPLPPVEVLAVSASAITYTIG